VGAQCHRGQPVPGGRAAQPPRDGVRAGSAGQPDGRCRKTPRGHAVHAGCTGRGGPRREGDQGVVAARATGRGPAALRADLGPAGCGSTESRCLLSIRAPPGSHLPASRKLPPPCRGRWTWLPVVVSRCGTPPSGPAAFDDCAGSGKPDVLWWTWPNLPGCGHRLSTATLPAAFHRNSRSAKGQQRGAHPLTGRGPVGDDAHNITRSAACRRSVRPPPSAGRAAVESRG
jgi:hypothetical protein